MRLTGLPSRNNNRYTDGERYCLLPDITIRGFGKGNIETAATRRLKTDQLSLKIHLLDQFWFGLDTNNTQVEGSKILVPVSDLSPQRQKGKFRPDALGRIISLILTGDRERRLLATNQLPANMTTMPPTVEDFSEDRNLRLKKSR